MVCDMKLTLKLWCSVHWVIGLRTIFCLDFVNQNQLSTHSKYNCRWHSKLLCSKINYVHFEILWIQMVSFSGFPCALFVLCHFSRLCMSAHRDGCYSSHDHDLWDLPDPWVCKDGAHGVLRILQYQRTERSGFLRTSLLQINTKLLLVKTNE